MVLASIVALAFSIAFLAFRYPKMLRNLFPGWLAATQPEAETPGSNEDDVRAEPKGTRDNGDSTPKANGVDVNVRVPSLSLSGDYESDEEMQESTVPSFPAANSAQRASAMPPRAKTLLQSNSGLMPPPSRPGAGARPSATASLRVPTTGPLPNRGLPPGSQQRVSGGLAPNGTVKTPNARGKVLLSPGHSPMDWAALTRKGNLSGVSTFQRVTPSQLKQMTGRKGKPAWSSWQGKVYNITPYLPFHPGGEAELMKAAGRDGTKLFMEVHPWVNWENMLGSCLVGVLVPEDYAKSTLEDMD